MGRNGCIALLEDVTDTAILPTIEEAPNLPPELIDEEGEEATLTTFPRLEINSRPQRTRKAPDRLNLAVISDHPLLLSVFHISARKALRDNKEESGPAIMLD